MVFYLQTLTKLFAVLGLLFSLIFLVCQTFLPSAGSHLDLGFWLGDHFFPFKSISLAVLAATSILLVPPTIYHSYTYNTNNPLPPDTITMAHLYSAHFYSVWSRRLWEICFPLVFVDIFGKTLLPTALYTSVVYVGVVCCQPFMGRWTDTVDRLRCQLFTISVENLSILITTLLLFFYSISHHAPNDFVGLMVVLGLFGVMGEVSINSTSQRFEKDWALVICSVHDREVSHVNVILRRIDLLAKTLAPALFGALYQSFGQEPTVRVCCSLMSLGLWTVLSFVLEMVLTRAIFLSVPHLKHRLHFHSEGTHHSHIDGQAPHAHLLLGQGNPSGRVGSVTYWTRQKCCAAEDFHVHDLPSSREESFQVFDGALTLESVKEMVQEENKGDEVNPLEEPLLKEEVGERYVLWGYKGFASSSFSINSWVLAFKEYKRSKIFLPSLAYGMLYFSVLTHGALMVAFLQAVGVDSYLVGLGRGSGALFGMLGTFLYERMEKHNSTSTSAIKSLWLFFLLLLPVAGAFLALPDSRGLSMLLVVLTSISRCGLWSFDLAFTAMFQEVVSEAERGVISSAHTSCYQLFFLMMFVAGMIFDEPSDFRVLVFSSVAMVFLSTVILSFWYAAFSRTLS